jgi:hypothetical protein
MFPLVFYNHLQDLLQTPWLEVMVIVYPPVVLHVLLDA